MGSNHLNPESTSLRRIDCRSREFSHISPFCHHYLPKLYWYFVRYWHLTASVSCVYPTISSASPLEHSKSNLNFTHPKLKSTFAPAPVLVLCAPVSGSSCLPGAEARRRLIPDPSPGLPHPIHHQFPQFCLQNITQTLSISSATMHFPSLHCCNSLSHYPFPLKSIHHIEARVISEKMSVILPHSLLFCFQL